MIADPKGVGASATSSSIPLASRGDTDKINACLNPDSAVAIDRKREA
jgi:hypothetical protein